MAPPIGQKSNNAIGTISVPWKSNYFFGKSLDSSSQEAFLWLASNSYNRLNYISVENLGDTLLWFEYCCEIQHGFPRYHFLDHYQFTKPYIPSNNRYHGLILSWNLTIIVSTASLKAVKGCPSMYSEVTKLLVDIHNTFPFFALRAYVESIKSYTPEGPAVWILIIQGMSAANERCNPHLI